MTIDTWAERRVAALPRGVGSATAVFAERALNAEIWDVAGTRYIDFAAGIAVLNVGHRQPDVMAAVERQLAHFTHTAFQVVPYPSYVRLAERLNALAPVEGAAKSILFTTGAEATENAVKIARVATGRHAVIAFAGGFHGRTLFASALTGKVTPYKLGFSPPGAGIYHLPFPRAYADVSVDATLRALDLLLSATVASSEIAAIIIEPIQGEGGFHVAPEELLIALRSFCDTHGCLLIADEVQTGFARTGKMFAVEHSGVKPDLIAMAKALGGGFPLSAVVGRADVMDAVAPGGLGGTYGGSPVGCAAALAVLDVIERDDLVGEANRIGDRIRTRLARLANNASGRLIANIRGAGAMIGFDVVPPDGGAPPADLAKALCARALERGLVLLTCGTKSEAIRLLPPLTISEATLDEGLDRLEEALATVGATLSAQNRAC